jgi:hypothetical protein
LNSVIAMTALKRSSKLLIYDSRRYLYCAYRAPGGWSNPNTISLIGTDGDTLEGVRRQVREKLDLTTAADDWSVTGTVENSADNELNTIWTLGRPLDHLSFRPAVYGGLLCLPPATLRLFDTMLSPALVSVMQAMPQIFTAPAG